jgi:hypothetical protein
MIFYVFPQSLALRTKTQGGAGGGSSTSAPSPSPLSQGETVDDAIRVTIDARTEACPRTQYKGGNAFRLRATPPATISEPHGAISKVELVSRIYRSESAGGDDWCQEGFTFPAYSPTNTLAAFICPFVDVNNVDTDNNGGLPASAYDWNHDYHSLITGQVTKAGHRIALNPRNVNFKDFSTGSSVSPSIPLEMIWDFTHLKGAWTDADIAALRFGLASWDNDQGFVASQAWSSGLAQGGSPSSSTPRWNVSQLVLKVTSADPPGQGNFIFLEE